MADKFVASPEFKRRIASFCGYMMKRLGIKEIPKLSLKHDPENASKGELGLTGYYNPESKSITIFTTNRHPTDLMRSFGHEVIHHWQNENGRLPTGQAESYGPGYAQKNPHMRLMEMQANMLGSMLYRDWQDQERGCSKMTECKECGCQFDFGSLNETRMGFVKCPGCLKEVDQEGGHYEF